MPFPIEFFDEKNDQKYGIIQYVMVGAHNHDVLINMPCLFLLYNHVVMFNLTFSNSLDFPSTFNRDFLKKLETERLIETGRLTSQHKN